MAFVSFRLPRTPVGLRLDGSYGVNTSYARSYGQPNEVQFLGGDVDVTVRLPSPKRVNVYLLGGFGRYKVTLSVPATVVGGTSTNHAWNMGGRITVGALFLENALRVCRRRGADVSAG
jgi:hypothetical protein